MEKRALANYSGRVKEMQAGDHLPVSTIPYQLPGIRVIAANYTLTAADNGYVIEVPGAYTVTLPTGLITNFRCDIVRTGANEVLIAGAATTTVNAKGTKLTTQYAACSVYHKGSNVWTAIGDLTA